MWGDIAARVLPRPSLALKVIPDVTCTAELCDSNLAPRRGLPFILLVIFNVSPNNLSVKNSPVNWFNLLAPELFFF